MPAPSKEAVAGAGAYAIGLHGAVSGGLAGERLGRGTGSSLEFEDRRAYNVGDDVRHLDWRAFGRTDELLVRVYREEILPRFELVIDLSASMGSDPIKAQQTIDVAVLLVEAAARDGLQPVIVAVGDEAQFLPTEPFRALGAEISGSRTLAELVRPIGLLLRPGALRVVVSDFLFPHDPTLLVRGLQARSGGHALVQVVTEEDVDPRPGRSRRLVDAETGETRDLVLDERAIAVYRDRVTRLRSALEQESRRLGGAFAQVRARASWEESCPPLVAAGVLVPR